MAAARFLVSGRVQGVYFRASARDRALALGVAGYARNLADGRVEVVAEGEAAALAQFEQWLHEGPSAARVDRVEREAMPAQGHRGFDTR